MKQSLCYILLSIIVLLVVIGAYSRLSHIAKRGTVPNVANATSLRNSLPVPSVSNIPVQVFVVPSKAERVRMSRADRLALMERLGHVFEDADWDEFNIAEDTTWWGKRIDPLLFWSNRVVWLDEGAMNKAWRYGRSWPPIPQGDTTCSNRNDEDHKGNGFNIQGGTCFSSVSSDREGAFWDKFSKTHPTPPAELARWQESRAEDWVRCMDILANDQVRATRLRLSPSDPNDMLESRQREANDMGYPSECVSSNALFWCHVMRKRKEYAKLVGGGRETNSTDFDDFFRTAHVDRKWITEPLTPEQLEAANEWKVAYLRRLRAQKTDVSYIIAYLQAWGLDTKAVFKDP